jgi:Uma2 family endonuclease
MSTATLPPPSGTATPATGLLLTAADVARLSRTLATTDVKYELHDGRLVVMAPPGEIHARRQARFAAYLFLHGEQPGHGRVLSEVGILLRRKPDHLVGPDAAFLTTTQLPPRLSPEGYLVTIPQLVVEVRSKNDTQPEIDEKVRDYLAAGVVLVWVADPDARTVTTYWTNQTPVVFAATDSLTADPVIPAFAVPVTELLRA